MADTQVIRDFSGRIVGYIETDAQGNKTVRDFYRVILGKYDKRNNVTRDFYGRVIARGDASASLIKFD